MPRRPKFRQLPLPFEPRELQQRAAPVLTPHLRELADAENLSDAWVQKLLQIASTARGYPKSVEDWRALYQVAQKFLREGITTDADAP